MWEVGDSAVTGPTDDGDDQHFAPMSAQNRSTRNDAITSDDNGTSNSPEHHHNGQDASYEDAQPHGWRLPAMQSVCFKHCFGGIYEQDCNRNTIQLLPCFYSNVDKCLP